VQSVSEVGGDEMPSHGERGAKESSVAFVKERKVRRRRI
jgi:hypothetical protein